MVELVQVAEGVLEPSDHLGTHPDRFLFKNRSWNMFQMFIFDQGFVVHLEVDFEGVVEVLGVNKMTWKISLHLVFVYSWWHAKFHWPRSKLETKRNPPTELLKNPSKLANCADFGGPCIRKYKLFQPYSCDIPSVVLRSAALVHRSHFLMSVEWTYTLWSPTARIYCS